MAQVVQRDSDGSQCIIRGGTKGGGEDIVLGKINEMNMALRDQGWKAHVRREHTLSEKY